jgi:hypothetical protein
MLREPTVTMRMSMAINSGGASRNAADGDPHSAEFCTPGIREKGTADELSEPNGGVTEPGTDIDHACPQRWLKALE